MVNASSVPLVPVNIQTAEPEQTSSGDEENVDDVVPPADSLHTSALFMLLSPTARMPRRATTGSVGYDAYADEEAVVPAHGRATVGTGVSVIVPHGCYLRVAPRSGLAQGAGVAVGGGVVDPDYAGEIKTILFNHCSVDLNVRVGDRVAQFVFERCAVPDLVSYSRGRRLDFEIRRAERVLFAQRRHERRLAHVERTESEYRSSELARSRSHATRTGGFGSTGV